MSRYRLQLATDEQFEDVVFDQAVEGRQYVVKTLPPGNYFWRVAAAAAETSATYSPPERVTLSDSSTKVEVANVLMPTETSGWRTATGEVVMLVPAQLRSGSIVDFVGVGADGRVFAIDGANGISLWTSRFAQGTAAGASSGDAAKSVTFAPLAMQTREGRMNVVVATQGGVRALAGETGRELWRATLEGTPKGGASADVDGDGSADVVVATEDPERLYVLNAASGRVLAQQKLGGAVLGQPRHFSAGATRGILVALKSNRVELRGADGAVIGEAKIDADVTTAPLVVARGDMPFAVVGTDGGLWALSLPELKTLGVIKAEGDSIRGVLASEDVDGDGPKEIVMVTKRGRVALINTTDGQVRWFVDGATDAASAAFADVNADGVLDVIVPGGSAFALGFSGRDGSLVMKVEEGGSSRAPAAKEGGALRSLVVTPSLSGGGMLVGGDPARMGLRAVELPKGSVRVIASN